MHALALINALAAEAEKSKTPFYVVGGALAAWALIVSAIGTLRHETFPGSKATRGVVMAISALLVIGAMITAVAVS